MNKPISNIKRNYLYQILYQVLVSVLPFITSPYISRVFGANGLGVYTYTYSIVSYFKMFAALGIANYGNRKIAMVKDDQKVLNSTFSSLFALHAILSAAAIGFYFIYWNLFVTDHKVIALIQILYLVGELLDINWFFYGMEEFRLTVTRNTVIKTATVAAVFIFVRNSEDLWKYVMIMAVGECASTSFVWIFLPKYVRFGRFSIKEMAQHLKPMTVLFFSVIATSVYSYMDRIMLGAVSSLEKVGYYENALKMIVFPVSFITSLGTVMMPKISNLIVRNDKKAVEHYVNDAMRFSMIAAMAIAFGVAGIAKEFSIVFWGKDFSVSGDIMMMLSVTIILMSWNSVIRMQFLIPYAHDKVYLLAVSFGAVINLCVNYMLIPVYDVYGAAVGTIMAYMGIFVIQTVYAAKSLPVFHYMAQSLPFAAIGLIMFGIVRKIGKYMGYTVNALLVEVVGGTVTFSVLVIVYGIIFKDVFILNIIKQLRNMKKTILGKKMSGRLLLVKEAGKKAEKSSLSVGVDMLFCKLLHCHFKEYIWYQLWNVPWYKRKEYAFEWYSKKMAAKYNNPECKGDKLTDYRYIKTYLKREYAASLNISYNEFCTFCENKKTIFYKPNFGCGGRGVSKYVIRDNLKELHAYLMRQDGILEEEICQHEEMCRLNPYSVNTIRIVTLEHKGTCEILYATQRMGISQSSVVDNASSGGLYAAVDIQTGKIVTDAVTDADSEGYQFHTLTNVKIKGFQIPMWDKVLKLIHECYDKIPGCAYVGWDVAISEEGPVIVEANYGIPGVELLQKPYSNLQKGQKHVLERYL